MSKATKPRIAKTEINKNVKTGEFETKVFSKSDSPKTLRENLKLALNVFLNFFG